MLIIRNDVKPESNIYYLGAVFLKYLQQHQKINIEDFFKKINTDYPSISINQILYTLDWLYILDLIDLIDEGVIIKCDYII
ncbi:ABC-three component system middle component 6 [Peribacillus simplex]|uniref:Uncharacterized protein n=1 Tax=Peribacillus simplex NBRC 15720 = DSM 1321 TaxID=1349754 RepID=A0A223EN66_9BACI|nr:ABC-three component system middle component 6 [Peribacillus simplex]ASS96634.1 hypothetical protein BS1321_23645 [Peribacillus simplex NBRC 15720 = DSM 1321]